MKYDIHGDNIEITDGIKTHIEDKLSKLEKYFFNPDNVKTRITAKVSGRCQNIEVTMHTDNFTIRAEESNEDLYSAIDLVIDKLEGQIRKNKSRIKKKHHTKSLNEINTDFEEDMLEEFEEKEVVKYQKASNKPMDVEEAILEMNLLGYDFFVYKDSETNEVAVLYRKRDGNYGVIETK